MNIITGTYSNLKKDEPKGKVIRNTMVARQILRKGADSVKVIDIKPDKTDPDRKRTVIVFEDNDTFQDILSSIIEENRKYRENREHRNSSSLQDELNDLKKKFAEFEKMTENINAKE